jgi:hypothetical protein
MHPVCNFPPYIPKIHSNIIFPSMPRSSQWSLPFRPSNQNTVCTSHLSHACYKACPSHPPRFDCNWMLLHSVTCNTFSLNAVKTIGFLQNKTSIREARDKSFNLRSQSLCHGSGSDSHITTVKHL